MSSRHPQTRFPQPPFEYQVQQPPGLDSGMKPRADHGEKSYEGHGRLQGRKALVTGGDSGIGRAVAIAYAREGADVAISYLPEEQADADEVIALIEKAGRKAVKLPGDIKDEAFCTALVEDAVKALGGLDILVNNAGKQQAIDSIDDITTQQFDETFKTNVYALFWITKAAHRHLAPGASVINSTSVQGIMPSPNLLDYAQTKASIIAFTRSLAQQWADEGIRVNAVAPGPFWTPLQSSGGQPPEAVQQFGAALPMKRPGQPVEIAPLYVTLATDEVSYCTGQVWGANGGACIA